MQVEEDEFLNYGGKSAMMTMRRRPAQRRRQDVPDIAARYCEAGHFGLDSIVKDYESNRAAHCHGTG